MTFLFYISIILTIAFAMSALFLWFYFDVPYLKQEINEIGHVVGIEHTKKGEITKPKHKTGVLDSRTSPKEFGQALFNDEYTEVLTVDDVAMPQNNIPRRRRHQGGGELSEELTDVLQTDMPVTNAATKIDTPYENKEEVTDVLTVEIPNTQYQSDQTSSAVNSDDELTELLTNDQVEMPVQHVTTQTTVDKVLTTSVERQPNIDDKDDITGVLTTIDGQEANDADDVTQLLVN